jgi:acyl carrier protein
LISRLRWQGSPSGLTSDYTLIEKEVLDSMAIFETIAYLEDEFGIEVQDDDLIPENFATIAAIARLVATSQSR